MAKRVETVLLAFFSFCIAFHGYCHSGSHASVHDTVATILDRFSRTLTPEERVGLSLRQVEALLTPAERQILSAEHMRFTVNAPVVVTVVRDVSLETEPFWLKERQFSPLPGRVSLREIEFDLWEKRFPAGEIGLGVPSITGKGVHYLVLVRPELSGNALKISSLYPGHLRSARFFPGVAPFVNETIQLEKVPSQLEGQWLVQPDAGSTAVAKLVNVFARTEFPARPVPDHAVLTWSDDPRTTQTVQWRTSAGVRASFINYHKMDEGDRPLMQRARTKHLVTHTLANDPFIWRHTVTLRDLQPATTYAYSLGDGSTDGWTAPAQFTTAPSGTTPFSFVYMGDAQNGLDQWGLLLARTHRARPDAAFYLMAGDLVNRGAERWDWDSFFQHSGEVFKHRPIVPVIGNHECQGGWPTLYLAQFELPRNGPKKVAPERAYSFDYSNARFVILDSNLDPASQTAWLEEQLSKSKATWKFVSYHHPAYSAAPKRDHSRLRDLWTPLFDKYHVDLALQGHDHSYLRTYPMRGQQRAASAADGTIYIVSVSGTKHYEQAPHDYTEVGLTKLSTYQVLDIQIQGNRLVYRAHDLEGNVRDEFIIQK